MYELQEIVNHPKLLKAYTYNIAATKEEIKKAALPTLVLGDFFHHRFLPYFAPICIENTFNDEYPNIKRNDNNAHYKLAHVKK